MNDKSLVFKNLMKKNITLSDYKTGKAPLYCSKDYEVNYIDFIKTMYRVGLKEGDTVLVHSDVLTFGKPVFKNLDIFFQCLVDLFFEVLTGDGTLIMPTFNYDFPKIKKFNIANTTSVTGALTNYFRKLKGVKRTYDPIHSHAIHGRMQNEYLNIGNETFGRDSVYGKLHSDNAKIMTFGTSFNNNNFFHYIETQKKVHYRYSKTFNGEIIEGSKILNISFEYFVRDLEKNVVTDTSLFVKKMKSNEILKFAKIGHSSISSAQSKAFFDFGSQCLDENIYCFLKKPYPQYD